MKTLLQAAPGGRRPAPAEARRLVPSALAWAALAALQAVAQVENSIWVYPTARGNLLYKLDDRGERIADFSHCGYRGGTEPLPNVSALIPQSRWVEVSPGSGDDRSRIQAAIDSVEAMPPDANGWRGVVYLNAGEYQLDSTLTIRAGGVVLKGAGDSASSGTRLRATDTRQYTLVDVRGSGGRGTVSGTTHELTQKLVPAGTRTFEVDSTSGLAVGHTVMVKRRGNADWMADIDMDQLVNPWTGGSKDLYFDRVITHLEDNWITVDAPLPQTFESQYGGGQVWRYTWSGRIQQVGIEDLYGFSDYASSTDEDHGWKFIQINDAQHAWVRNITAQYFGYSAVSVGDGAKWITVADSQCLDPVSVLDGGRRYSFSNEGAELTLFVNNYARKGRHDFVFGATVSGPNAFVHGDADTVYSDTGPHHRWSVGGLFDNITINGNELNVRNRGNSGDGHGWAGAYMAVWNSAATTFRVRNPPTARNWLVGSVGAIADSGDAGGTPSGPVGADPEGTYDRSGPAGQAVYPRSLYYAQLQQRLKWAGSEFREVWLGDVDQHYSTGGDGHVVNCISSWLAQVEAMSALPAGRLFDYMVDNRYTAFTFDFTLDPGDTVVSSSLTVSLRAIGSADNDSIWVESTADPQTFASLGWTPISTSSSSVRTLILDSSLLSDGRLHVAVGDDCSVDFAVLHMQVQPAPPPTHTVTLTPVADAYVRGGSYADDNFGTASALETKEDSNASVVRESFLRWDLSGLSGRLLQAKVRLAGTGVGQAGNESCASLVSSDTWGESSLTFNNKPSSGKLFAQWLPVDGQAVEFSVTPQAAATLLGDKKLSLRIASTGDYGDSGNVSYASSENSTAANRPQLILSFEDTAPEIGHVANQTVSANTPTAALPFTVGDDYTAAGSLTVSGRSSNTNLVPNANLVFGGSGANRTVKVTPAANQSGSTTITLTVSDGTLTASDTFVLTVTAPPTAGGLAVTTMEDHYIDVDLWALASDAVTADGDLLFEVSNATNGAVTLLADGHTARFTPNTNVTGAAGFRYTVTDVGNDSRLFLHYSFEPPDTLADLRVTDNSGNGRTGTVEDLGTGDSYYSAAVPPALSPYSTIALKLTEAGAGNGSCFRRTITSAELNLNTHDWTFAGWFQRLSSTNNDFVFYLGGSDGFGGLGEELEVYCPANQDKLTLLHYNAANTSDANISSDPSVASNEWHHAAVTFNAGAGRLSLYLDGSLVGSETNLSLGFDQTSPVVFGGHNSSDAGVDRWFNGRLDDLAMFTDDLPASTVARLASRTVGHFGGLSATGAVAVTVAAVNDAPVLAAVSNRTIGAGQVLAITNAASDIDLPAQALTFSLLQNPTGAMLGASSGVLTWRPAVAQANSTNLFRVRVADNGTPTLSATQQFSVVVRPLVAAAVTQPAATDGLFRLTVAGDAGPDYAVQASTNFVDWSTIFTAVAPALPFSWTDTNAVNCMRRFYRARLGP